MNSAKTIGAYDRRRIVRRCVECTRLRRGARHYQEALVSCLLTLNQCDGHFPCSRCLSRGVECHGPVQQVVSSPVIVHIGSHEQSTVNPCEETVCQPTKVPNLLSCFFQFVHAPSSPFTLVFSKRDCQNYVDIPSIRYAIQAMVEAVPNCERPESLDQTIRDAAWRFSIRRSLSRNLNGLLSEPTPDQHTVMLLGTLTAICQVSSPEFWYYIVCQADFLIPDNDR